jgi:tetratricopeptide (TPR) repeat protein
VKALAFMMLFLFSACGKDPSVTVPQSSELPAFDTLWDFDQPAATEARFRELLSRAKGAGKAVYAAELMTQIARTQGLQQKFAEAHRTLDEVESLLKPDMGTVKIRSRLERGRVFNSSGKVKESVPVFTEALELARKENLENYAIDAAHMLGIVEKGRESLKWNNEAIRMAEAASDPRSRRWLGPLYNNTGWTYFDLGEYAEALKLFERDIEFRKQGGNNIEIGIARWSAAKMLRHLGRVEESLQRQMELLNDPDRKGNDAEGYTREEIAECLLILKRPAESTPYFARAWELLRNDPWLSKDEPQRLARLKKLGGR